MWLTLKANSFQWSEKWIYWLTSCVMSFDLPHLSFILTQWWKFHLCLICLYHVLIKSCLICLDSGIFYLCWSTHKYCIYTVCNINFKAVVPKTYFAYSTVCWPWAVTAWWTKQSFQKCTKNGFFKLLESWACRLIKKWRMIILQILYLCHTMYMQVNCVGILHKIIHTFSFICNIITSII